jgi:hypothetical protein
MRLLFLGAARSRGWPYIADSRPGRGIPATLTSSVQPCPVSLFLYELHQAVQRLYSTLWQKDLKY